MCVPPPVAQAYDFSSAYMQTATENQSKKSGQAEGATAGALAKLSNKMGTKMSDRLFGYMEHM